MAAAADVDPAIHLTAMEEKYLSAHKSNDSATINEMLIAKEIDPDQRIGNSKLLLMAIIQNLPNIVKTLIDNGANIAENRSKEPYQEKALHMTLLKIKHCRRSVLMARESTNEGWDTQISSLLSILDIIMGALEKISMETLITKVFADKDIDGTTSFVLACREGLDDIVIRFLNLITDETRHFFTDISWFIIRDNRNPFHFVYAIKPDTVSVLNDRLPFRKSLLNMDGFYGESTPLHIVARSSGNLIGQPGDETLAQIAKLFLDASANPDLGDSIGSTPLHCAVWSDNEPVVETLLRGGCRLDIHNDHEDTPLGLALHRPFNIWGINVPASSRMVELLLAFGVDLQQELYLYTVEEKPEITESPLCFRSSPGYIPPTWLEACRQLRRSNDMISLQRMCRNTIRRHLKPRADEVIKGLTCIPNNLKSYLLVENEPVVLDLKNLK